MVKLWLYRARAFLSTSYPGRKCYSLQHTQTHKDADKDTLEATETFTAAPPKLGRVAFCGHGVCVCPGEEDHLNVGG